MKTNNVRSPYVEIIVQCTHTHTRSSLCVSYSTT